MVLMVVKFVCIWLIHAILSIEIIKISFFIKSQECICILCFI